MATLTSPQIAMAIKAALGTTSSPVTNTSTINHERAFTPTVGSSAGNVNKVYSSPFTVAASGTALSIDLTSLTDPLGNAISISTLNALMLSNDSTTAGQNMILSTTIANQLFTMSSAVKIPAGTTPGALCLNFGTTGIVVDATHKIVLIDIEAGTNITGKITILGK